MAFEDPPPGWNYGENKPMPRSLQGIAVVLALASLGFWLYMVVYL
jgi:hypothetical protein